MFNLRRKSFILPIIVFFIFYLLWLFRAYTDVIWMDQIRWMAGNIHHFYAHKFNLLDFFYVTPYNQSFSILWALVNCKLFSYDTTIDNVLSGVILFTIAIYFVRCQLHLFTPSAQPYFAALSGLIVFGLHKWEASLNGMGLGFYVVFLIIIICMDLAHKYYLNQFTSSFLRRYFIPLYVCLVSFTILEYGPYFTAFEISILCVLFVNRGVFRDKIDLKKWKILLLINVALIVCALALSYFLNSYSANHSYDGYSKTTISASLKTSLHRVFSDPIFVIKFFFIANTGNLVDNESYLSSPFFKHLMPFVGLLVIFLYGRSIYTYIKKRRIEYVYLVNLIVFVILFYGLVTISRLYFNDLYYGSSSRYSAATFSGILALATLLLAKVHNDSHASLSKKFLGKSVTAAICLCYLITDRSQWKIAPYRKEAYEKLVQNLKSNNNLETLQADVRATEIARKVMIKYHLNAFRPQQNLNNFSIKSNLRNVASTGFYNLETSTDGQWRWTNGSAEIFLPNLYTENDLIKVALSCYLPYPDTPTIVLNDSLYPIAYSKNDKGFEYSFDLGGSSVLYRMQILSKSFKPHLLNKDNSDERTLGLVFSSVSFKEEPAAQEQLKAIKNPSQ